MAERAHDSAPTPALATAGLQLSPLRPSDAEEMAVLLADPELYLHTGGEPPSTTTLRERYERQTARDPTGREEWHNWIIRVSGKAVGFAQATVSLNDPCRADLAWVIGTDHQRRGYASTAAAAVLGWLLARGIEDIGAWINPANLASAGVARALGMTPGEEPFDGELRWSRQTP